MPGELERLVDEAFHGPTRHGPSLWSTLKGVTWSQALWRPAPGRNTIWELVLHTAHGKHIVRRRLAGGDGPRFVRPVRKAWWPRLPAQPDAAAWRADLALLRECHEQLMQVVRRPPRPSHQQIMMIALHDTYHAGQIRLLRRLAAADGVR
jgi:DinB superfamily